MRQLPKDEITIERSGAHVIVGAHENNGIRHFTKYRLSDLPNDLVSVEDLKGLGIDLVDMRSVEQF